MVTVSTRDAERILISLFDVRKDRAGPFLERLKQLRHLGVPSGVPKGRGIRTGRSLGQMVELTLAVQLLSVGLSSSHVARLMQTEWTLASSALSVFDWTEIRDETGCLIGSAEAFWLAEPEGLAEYRQRGDESLPRLATVVLIGAERLQDKIDEWAGRRGWATVVIPARLVIQELLAAYLSLGVANEIELQGALWGYRNTNVAAARALVPLR